MDYPKNNLYYDEYNYEDEDNSKNKRKDEDISENTSEDENTSENGKIYLSGPTSAHFGEKDGIIYMLFGDDHSNMENLCSDPCTHLDLEGNVVHHEGCYDIISSLSMIFENNEGTENMIDFYLETPYAYKNSYPEDIKKVCEKNLSNPSSNFNFLEKILCSYIDCFFQKNNKINLCKFKNTRFHSSDIRLRYDYVSPKSQTITRFISTLLRDFLYNMLKNNTLYEDDFLILDILIKNFIMI